MASLATTIENTIKMADVVQKHGCRWCIRSIAPQDPVCACCARGGGGGMCDVHVKKCDFGASVCANMGMHTWLETGHLLSVEYWCGILSNAGLNQQGGFQ